MSDQQTPKSRSVVTYKDPAAAVDSRVEDLLSRMTLQEKVMQLCTTWSDKSEIFDDQLEFDAEKAEKYLPWGIGQIGRPSDHCGPISPRIKPGRNAQDTVRLVNAAQKWAVEQTRLGIPVLFHEESLHGYAAPDTTSFPQAIALASSWDVDLVEEVHALIASEIRVRGVHLALSPIVDIVRDPRWGRTEETYGEDPFLVAELGCASVKGLQGDDLPLADGKVFATLKHMTGHGQPESGTNIGPAPISERTLRESFFPPFEEVVTRTRVGAVMASYNEIDGIPSHANEWLLQDVLRGEWGYEGLLVSDYWAIEQLADIHHVEPDHEAAAIRAISAGVDADMPDGACFRSLVDAVDSGRLREDVVDRSVRRMLAMKFNAGLFENPYADGDIAEAMTGTQVGSDLALKAAHRSPVLLKNNGLLPLTADSHADLAVIGPNAEVCRIGGYPGQPRRKIGLLQGIRDAVGDSLAVHHAEGVRITENDDWWADEVLLVGEAENRPLIEEAVKVASSADVVVLALGDTEQTCREAWDPGHLGDRPSLELPGQQNELANAILDLGKPTVVVLFNGRPAAIKEIADKADAILEAWYLGQETGTAAADILFGKVNPSGKLPITFARSAGQLPLYYNMKPSARRRYLFEENTPLFPFGFGLSYTTFEISEPRLSRENIEIGDSTAVQFTVTNRGDCAGTEVVQLYIRDRVSSATRPVRELRGFERVELAVGDDATVTFEITPGMLSFWDKDMQRTVEPGEFEIMIGPNSVDLKSTVLTVVGND